MRAKFAAAVAICAILSGCEEGGTSTIELRQAAIDKARQELGLAADVQLEATTWAGAEHEDQVALCGTVSGTGNGGQVQPQRFAATGDPIRWLVFEDAHDPLLTSQPDKFPEWERLCAKTAGVN